MISIFLDLPPSVLLRIRFNGEEFTYCISKYWKGIEPNLIYSEEYLCALMTNNASLLRDLILIK
jgi:hypothetical protein